MNKLHFIGIKGSGMSALALICQDLGYEVVGSDVPQVLFTQKKLEERNIPIFEFSAENIKGDADVIIGASFDENHPEVKATLENKTIQHWYYYDYLAKLINEHVSISVAGSHGKTTTTGMLQTLLNANAQAGYLIGDGNGQLFKESKYFVVESCEYKDHFLNYTPDYAIITNIDLDHVDYFRDIDHYFESFQKFVHQVKKGAALFGDDELILQLDTKDLDVLTYGLNPTNDIYATNIEIDAHQTHFDLIIKDENKGRMVVDFVGLHNLCNLLSTVAIATMLKFNDQQILKHLNDFRGVNRRFVVEEFEQHVYIDDYAHHPTEIRVTIDAARLRFPESKIVIVYKPDRVSRIQYFEKGFKEALETADKAYVLDFPAQAYQENPEYSLEKFLGAMGSAITYLSDDQEGVQQLAIEKEAVYLFVSPKDIYKFKDKLKEHFGDLS